LLLSLPPPALVLSLNPRELRCFVFSLEFLTVDVRFLLTIKVMELLFPLVDMVVIVFSLILLNYDGLYLCFFFLFLLYFCRNAQI
jgi:hypothetical protein